MDDVNSNYPNPNFVADDRGHFIFINPIDFHTTKSVETTKLFPITNNPVR